VPESQKNICPYPGLRPFNEHESLFFKGRDMHISKLSQQLEQKKFLMVTGASGDGKSSLVYAGLIPKIKAGFFNAQFNNWKMAIFRPENNPFSNLVNALSEQLGLESYNLETTLKLGYSALAGIYRNSDLYFIKPSKEQKKNAANLLIVVDQFEEFFTNKENFNRETATPSVSAQNVVNLLIETAKIAKSENLPIYILCTMRSDFIGNAPAFRGLPEFIGDHQYYVPRLTRDEVYQVITEPATLSGNRISQRLAQRMLNDLNVINTDILPVLQHALKQIWIKANRGEEELDLVHFAMVGGMAKNELEDKDKAKFQAWFDLEPFYIEQFYKDQSLNNVLNIHANSLFMQTHDYVNRNTDRYKFSKREARELLQKILKCFTKIDDSKAVRNRMTVLEISEIIGEEDVSLVVELLNIFREESNNLIYPFMDDTPESRQLKPDTLLDITHESLIRNWRLLSNLTKEEHNSGLEFKEIHSHIFRWVEANKEDNQLLSVGGYSHFKNWFDKQQPNGAWIARYLENDIYKSDGIMIKSIEKLRSVTEIIEGEEPIESSTDENGISNESQIAEVIRIFLNKSHEQIVKIKRARKRTITIISTLAIVATLGFLWAMFLRVEMKTIAHANSIATKASTALSTNPTLSFRLAEAAYNIYPTELSKRVIINSYAQKPFYKSLKLSSEGVDAMFSPNGKYVLTISRRYNGFRLWDFKGTLLDEFEGYLDFESHSVSSANFSANSKYIVFGGGDGALKLYEVNTGEIKKFLGHEQGINSVMFSPDDKYILTASKDATARVWDLQGNIVFSLAGHSKSVRVARFSPDQKYIFSASTDQTLILWSYDGVQLDKLMDVNVLKRYDANFSYDSKYIATPSFNNKSLVWNFKENKVVVLEGHTDVPWTVQFSPDSKLVLTSSIDNTARLWDLKGNELKVLRGHSAKLWNAVFSPNGKLIATVSDDCTVGVWDLDGNKLHTLKGHASQIYQVNFSYDSRYVITTALDHTSRIWDLEYSENPLLNKHFSWVDDAQFSPNGKYIVTGGYDYTGKLWDNKGNYLAAMKGHTQYGVYITRFTKDGKYIMTGGLDKTVRLWDYEGNEIQIFIDTGEPTYVIELSEDKEHFITAWFGDFCKLWNIKSGFIHTFKHTEHASFSPKLDYIVTVGTDSTITFYEHPNEIVSDTLKLLHQIKIRSGGVNLAYFTPDGTRLVVTSINNDVYVYKITQNIKEIELLNEDSTHNAWIRYMSFSSTAKHFATASNDNTAIIWDYDGNVIAKLIGHTDAVNEVNFSKDGKYLVTASTDFSVRVWDIKGEELQVITAHSASVVRANFSPDGNYILSASNDQTALLLPWRVEDVLHKINVEKVRGDFWELNEEDKKLYGITN